MGIFVELVDHERGFEINASTDAVILNDLDDTSLQQKEDINRTIYTVSRDVLSNVPACECGETKGKYSLGVICPNCRKPVKIKLESKLEPLVWARAPEGVAPFLNPRAWMLLCELYCRNNNRKDAINILQHIADVNYRPRDRNNEAYLGMVRDIENAGITGRGWNYFYENFDFIMETLLTIKSVRKGDKKYNPKYDYLKQFLAENRDVLFSRYIPFPNKSLLIIEEDDTGKSREKSIDGIVDAVRLMVGIDLPKKAFSVRAKESRVVKMIANLATYYTKFDELHANKLGAWRKHVISSRANFSSRAVITSLTEPHRYDELHFPWGVSVSLLRYHLLNKLFKLGYSYRKATNLLNTYALEYHPLINRLFKELIAESPYPGIPVIHIRNPVMLPGSTQLLYITKVKTNHQDSSISTSILIVVPFNLDFDGDTMISMMTLDNNTTNKMMGLSPHISGFSTKNPLSVSNHVWLPKPVIANIFNWIHHESHDVVDEDKLAKMKATFNLY